MNDIKSFKVQNYKSLKYTPDIPLKGLSLFIGENSSGKSNILESLMLFKQTIENSDLNSPLVLNGNLIELGEFSDIIFNHEEKRNLVFSFNMEVKNTEINHKKNNCPLCNNSYESENKWFYKHLRKYHNNFFQNNESSIENFQQFKSGRDTELSFSYVYRGKPKTTKLKKVSITNVGFQNSIFLKEISLVNEIDNNKLLIKLLNGPKLSLSCDDIEIDTEDNRLTPINFRNKMLDILENFLFKNDEIRRKNDDTIGSIFRFHPDGRYRISFNYNNEKSDKLYEHISENNIQDELDNFLKGKQNLNEKTINFLLIIYNLVRKYDRKKFYLYDFLKNIFHVGPIREEPERIHFGSSGKPRELGDRGENLSNIIIHDREYSRSTDSIVDKTNKWLEKTGFNCSIDVRGIGRSDLHEIIVKEEDLQVNIRDVGFGLSQILPIIFQTIKVESSKKHKKEKTSRFSFSRKNKAEEELVMLEQPEVHLNPRIESELGDFFKEMVLNDLNLMIETHSEHMLSRIQRRVSEGKLDRNKVNVFFVNKKENISEIEKLNIRESGEFENWPSGFFQDDYEDSVEIFKNSIKQNR